MPRVSSVHLWCSLAAWQLQWQSVHTRESSPLPMNSWFWCRPMWHAVLVCLQIAMGVSEEKLQPLVTGNLPTDLLVLCHACCDFDPDMRPGFATIVEELEKVLGQMKVSGRQREWVQAVCVFADTVRLQQQVGHRHRQIHACSAWICASVQAWFMERQAFSSSVPMV